MDPKTPAGAISNDDGGSDQAWHEEIEQRVASLENGSAVPVAWEDVQARIARRLIHFCTSSSPALL